MTDKQETDASEPDAVALTPPAAPDEEPEEDDDEPPVERIDELATKFPLERVARVSASLHLEPERRADILEANALTDAEWSALEARTRAEIGDDAKRGSTARLALFDRTYLARITEERGEITVGDYARLIVAQERSSIDATHADLRVPREALMPLGREWQKRCSEDPNIASALRAAIKAARSS